MTNNDKVMKLEKAMQEIEPALSPILGVAGTASGCSAVQTIAYLPALLKLAVSKGLSTIHPAQKLQTDLDSVIAETCIQVQKSLESSKESEQLRLSRFFGQVSLRINESPESFEIRNLDIWLRNIMKKDEQWEDVPLSEENRRSLYDLFLRKFVEQLDHSSYHLLNQSLIWDKIEQHDIQIEKICQKVKMLDNKVDNLQKNTDPSNNFPAIPDMYSMTGSTYLTDEVLNDDLSTYSDKYEEPLFLHKNYPKDKQIHLKDVYTLPSAKSLNFWKKNSAKLDYDEISDVIQDFLSYNPQKDDPHVDFMFIEGQPAMGKSSLVSWLSWHYLKEPDKLRPIIGNRRLIAIRLFDLLNENEKLNSDDPFADFTTYLYPGKLKHREMKKIQNTIYTNAILILDGFDELCMAEGILDEGKTRYFTNMNRELKAMNCGCKVIVTTRPNYLDVNRLDLPSAYIEIVGFSSKKRNMWLKQYEQHAPVAPDVKTSLLQQQGNLIHCLLESPLTLYMITTKGIKIEEHFNNWEIYHQIFSDEIYIRSYEKSGSHSVEKYKKALYELTAEIANVMITEGKLFTTENKLLQMKQIRELIKELSVAKKNQFPYSEKVQAILTDCFGIASYFKTKRINNYNGIKTVIEFYHNNIRDYFYCEYIWIKLQEIYKSIPNDETEIEIYFMSIFQELFQHVSLFNNEQTPVPIQFLSGRVHYIKNHPEESQFYDESQLLMQEHNNHYFPKFFGRMLQAGMLYSYQYNKHKNVLNLMANMFSSVYYIYRTIYLPYLMHGDRVLLSNKKYLLNPKYISNISETFYTVSSISKIKDYSYFNFNGLNLMNCTFFHCNLENADLSHVNLSNTNLSGSCLSHTDLSHADLSYADLSHTNLSYADLSYVNLTHTNLSHADLSHANLSHVDLSGANLSNTSLYCANLSGADLICTNLSNTNLSGTNLSGTKLIGSNLSHANLSCARLISTDLSHATFSYAILFLAKLSHAHLFFAHLFNTDFSYADLSGAKLFESDLALANLSNTRLIHTDFKNTDLSDTNFSNTDISNATFKNCICEGTIWPSV